MFVSQLSAPYRGGRPAFIHADLKSQSLELTLLDAWLERLRLLRLPLPLSEYSDVNDNCEKSQLDRSLSMMMKRRAPTPPNMPRLHSTCLLYTSDAADE